MKLNITHNKLSDTNKKKGNISNNLLVHILYNIQLYYQTEININIKRKKKIIL